MLGRFLKTLRSLQRQVNRRPQGKQALVGADVAGGFVSTNVLFTRLQSQYPTSIALPIRGLTCNPPRHASDKRFATSHDAQIRPAELQRVAQWLTFANDDVGSPSGLAGEQSETDQISYRHDHGARLLGCVSRRSQIFHDAEKVGLA